MKAGFATASLFLKDTDNTRGRRGIQARILENYNEHMIPSDRYVPGLPYEAEIG